MGVLALAAALLTLLQHADAQCALNELMSLSANLAANLPALMSSNPPCAACVVACASSANQQSCGMACVSSTSGSGAASSSSGSGMPAAQRATSAPEPDLFARGPDDPPRGTTAARLDLPLDLSGNWAMTMPNGITANQWVWQECLEVTITGNASLPDGTPVVAGPLHHMIADARCIPSSPNAPTERTHAAPPTGPARPPTTHTRPRAHPPTQPDSQACIHNAISCTPHSDIGAHTLESRYETYDDTGSTTTDVKGIMRYKTIIAAPTKMEAADGATATLVFYVDSTIAG